MCHECGIPRFLLPLRPPADIALRQALMQPRQFDEYIWFYRTQAVTPFVTEESKGMPDTDSFGL